MTDQLCVEIYWNYQPFPTNIHANVLLNFLTYINMRYFCLYFVRKYTSVFLPCPIFAPGKVAQRSINNWNIVEKWRLNGCVALFRQPITPTAHYSDNPLLRRPIFPTMQNRTQSTNPWFNQVYPTGWSVSQANLDGPWPRQNVLERKRSFYPRLYIPVQGNYDRPTWYRES
jgi:hypothetical protein